MSSTDIESKIERHNDFINDVILYGHYGYKGVNELYLYRDWVLSSKDYVSLGARISVIDGEEEIKEENRHFIHEKKNKRIAEVMNEDGTYSKIELIKPAILYSYLCDIPCCLEDRENRIVRSYSCHFLIMEYDGQIYIPRKYEFEDIFRKEHPKDVELSTLIEELDVDNLDDIDNEMLNKLINTLSLNGLTELAERVEIECGEKTFNDAVLLLKSELLDLRLNEIKLVKNLIDDFQKEYVDIVSQEIKVAEDEDIYDEIDDGYVRSRVFFSVRKLNKNNKILITMQAAEDPYEKVSLKLIARKKYFDNQEILNSAFNSLCMSLVFQNQCWFKSYENEYEV